jgi:predicted phage terminase large subunit-like protein
MKIQKVRNEAMVEAARRLYVKYGGCEHRRIEAEMRAAGWQTFSRRYLMDKTHPVSGERVKGWVRRFEWDKLLEKKRRAAEKKAARESGVFEAWLEAQRDGMTWTAAHHRFIIGQLKRITDGEVKRLMLFVPPRHGKSELVTVRYSAWRLARDPRENVIIGCYSQKLANRFSRKIRKIAAGSGKLSRKVKAADEWETTVGGGVKAVGVGAGITGFGGSLVIIDDPVKSRAQANSLHYRERAWDWYRDDISTRLEPGAAVVLIQTRWHDDDLAGRLLKEVQDGGEAWEVVRMPAIAEAHAWVEPLPAASPPRQTAEGAVCHPSLDKEGSSQTPQSARRIPHSDDPLGRAEGEALWPERFDREALLATRRRLGAWSFAALYQQRPVPAGGALFKPEWFARRVSRAPEGLRWCRGYDLAVSLKNSADYTASFRCAFDKRTGDLYIADGFRRRIEFPEQRRYVIERLEAEPDTRHGIELALHGQALLQDLRREPRTRGRVLKGVKVDADKLMRAEAWATLAEEGKVVIVEGAWVNDFLDEVCRFTGRGDAHDDQVDAVSLAVQMLNGGRGFKAFD